MLAEFDPISAARLHPNNLRRIIRAVEFYKLTGIPISEHQEMTKQTESRYEPIMFCSNHDREVLYERINRRVDMMIEEGLLQEVQKLMDMGYTKELNSMKGIGYKEIMDYYNGECTLDEATEAVKQGSRRYAKRQLTWFRRDERIIMLSPDNATEKAVEITKSRLGI
jgi:tRNA dimethylallyltransferase